ncbi:hypothetical protein BRC86_01365 [Halobacteriales archaeon QS_3_64_16]|nr:MAG: hypothetical protein BRC86_01365 [Halobacteriales archaeon QS_3_64_16]
MRVRDWQDVVKEVTESDADPSGWRAVGGDRKGGLGEDLYLGHPGVGVYQLKTYAKNPLEVRGVGTQVARQVDDDIQPYFPAEGSGHFGVQSPVESEEEAEQVGTELESVLSAHAEAPTTSEALFEDVMGALDSPAYGPLSYDREERSEHLGGLTDTFEEAEAVLETEFDDLVEEDEVGRGFQ